MYRVLFFLTIAVLLCTKFGWTGQSLEHFSDKVQLKNSGWPVALLWLDNNLDSINVNTPLYIQQNGLANYYLYAYRIDSSDDENVKAMLKVESNINLSLNSCGFSSNNRYCSVHLEHFGDTIGDKASRIRYEPKDGVSFHASSKDISIFSIGNENVIEYSASLTAITVSDEPKQDNVPLKIRAKASENLQQIHLEFEIEDTTVADFEGKNTQACDINFTGDEPLACDKLIQVTPYAIGKTKINFILDKSYWITKDSNIKNYYTSLKPIQVNVGTLFAGYSGARVYRKNSTKIFNNTSENIISLAVDQPSHKLYALLPELVYSQENVTNQALTFSKDPIKVSDFNGRTLGLTNIANRIIIGSNDASFYRINNPPGQGWGIAPLRKMFGSIISSALDKENNITYFSDNKNSFGIYYSIYVSNNKEKFEVKKSVIDPQNYSNMLVAANNNVVYAAVSKTAEAATAEPLSKLFVWVNEKMIEVKITGENPFMATSYISMLVFHHDHLYAGTSDGKLYYLNRENAQFKWQLVATTTGEIVDSAIDMNGNIYLANKQNGVWKVSFNANGNINPAYKILNYSQDENSLALTVNTIAIDNNL